LVDLKSWTTKKKDSLGENNSQELAEQREFRLSACRGRHKARHAAMRVDQRAAKLEWDATGHQQRRVSEGPEERAARLEGMLPE